MFRTFWMVLGRGTPSVHHATQEAAEREAERLSRQCPGEAFYVLEAVSKVVRSDVHWDRAHPDADPEPIPF